MDVISACRKVGVSDKTYYGWRKKFGGMGRSKLSEMKSQQKENDRLKKIVGELELDKLVPKKSLDFLKAKGLTQEQQRQAVIHTRQKLNTSERRTCRVMGVAHSTLKYKTVQHDDDAVRLAMIRLANAYGRYGYRKITQLLQIQGWKVNHKQVERLWREEGL